jgi:hypothetical protein
MKKRINSVTQGIRTKPKLYIPLLKKKQTKLPKKVKSHIECPSNLSQNEVPKQSRTLTSIAPQCKNSETSDYFESDFGYEPETPSLYSKTNNLSKIETTPNSTLNNLVSKTEKISKFKIPRNQSREVASKLKNKNIKIDKKQKLNKNGKKNKKIKPVSNFNKIVMKKAKKTKRESKKKNNPLKSKNFRTGVLKTSRVSSKFGSTRMVGSQRFL